jgi:hypothetical protein
MMKSSQVVTAPLLALRRYRQWRWFVPSLVGGVVALSLPAYVAAVQFGHVPPDLKPATVLSKPTATTTQEPLAPIHSGTPAPTSTPGSHTPGITPTPAPPSAQPKGGYPTSAPIKITPGPTTQYGRGHIYATISGPTSATNYWGFTIAVTWDSDAPVIDPTPVIVSAPNGLPCNANRPEYYRNIYGNTYEWWCNSITSEWIGKYGDYPVTFGVSSKTETKYVSGVIHYQP